MAEFDVFLSYASKDLDTAEKLEKWLQDPPRNRQVWRDRRGLLPGAPDYYPPIRHAIETSAVFLLLLSPSWLGSEVAGRELSDAQSMSKKRIIVVHHSIARDPHTPQGFKLKSELEKAVEASGLASVLKPANWIWLKVKEDQREPNFAAVEDAVAIDFPWAARHAIITERLNRWKDIRDPGSLLRGRELSELLSDAFADLPGRLPVLNDEQRAFLLESQRQETDELRRVEGLYWDAQTRAVAFAARERGEAEPDLALLLAAEAVAVAPVTEARSALFSLLHRHASLSTVLRGHGSGR